MVLRLEEQTLPLVVDLSPEGDNLLYIVYRSEDRLILNLEFTKSRRAITVNVEKGVGKQILDVDLNIDGSEVKLTSGNTPNKLTISLKVIKNTVK